MSNVLGTPPLLTTLNGHYSGLASAVPIELLQQLQHRVPVAVTVGGSNNGTFTLAASVTKPFTIWCGKGVLHIRENVVFTWTNTANQILNSSGVIANDADSVLGVWYMYIDEDGTTLYPSQTAPGFVEAPFNAGYLGHPGTSRVRPYLYVGPMICTTAATPAFSAMVKIGWWWRITEVEADVPSASWAAPTNLTLFIPKLGFAGGMVNIGVENGLGGRMYIGANSASTLWDAELGVQEVTSNVALQTSFLQFIASPNDTTSPIYARAVLIAGKIHVNGFKDIV